VQSQKLGVHSLLQRRTATASSNVEMLCILTVVVAVDAKLTVNSNNAGIDLKTIENKIVLRLKRILAEHSAGDTDSDKVKSLKCLPIC